MEDELDAKVIRNTQMSLGKYVKRPPLTEKLLSKPPFRFLHDIVTSVIKTRGFFEGLFDENELISENVKDRESKITFLNKVISVVSLTTGKSLLVKPSKIVAGQEPAKTNELLQCLAQALDNNLSSDEAVKQFKTGLKTSSNNNNKHKESVKSVKRDAESKKNTSRSRETLISNDRTGKSLNNKDKKKEISPQKKESPPKKSLSKAINKLPTEKSDKERKKNNSSNIVSVKQHTTDNLSQHIEQKLVSIEDTNFIDKESTSNCKIIQPDINIQEDLSIVSDRADLDVNESISMPIIDNNTTRINDQNARIEMSKDENLDNTHSFITNEIEIKHDTDERQNKSSDSEKISTSEVIKKEGEESTRLPTAKSFNKKDSNSSNITRAASVRPSSSRPGAPRIKDKSENVINDTENVIVGKVTIISENTLHEEDESTSIIIDNNATEELSETLQNQEHHNTASNQNSHLVQQILDSQREFSQISGKTEIEWQFGAQKPPNVFVQEMEELKFSVQALSRIANPLGKLLDHIQEDVEVMRQELQQWTKIFDETSNDLLKQKTVNEDYLLPFHAKLKQLTADIENRHVKITDLKISVHKNNTRIEKLLASDNVQ